MSASSWERVLGMILPDEVDSLLLKMCLLEGEACAQAATRWFAIVGSPTEYFRRENRGRKRLLPLLARALKTARVEVAQDFGAALRAARLHEELRVGAFRRQMRAVLDALFRADLEVVVLPGVALVPRHYRDWPLRHCHDLDLWLAAPDMPRAAEVMRGEGMARVTVSGRHLGSSSFSTGSGLEVALHSHLSPMRLFEPPRGAVLENRQVLELDGSPFAALGDTDMLLHVCLVAAGSPARRSLRWACDAVRLLDGSTTLDWGHFARMARGTGAELPLALMLGFLSEVLDAPVPPRVISCLTDEAEIAPRLEEVFCHLVARDPDLEVGDLMSRATDLQTRTSVVRHLLLPTRSFLERERGLRGRLEISGEYCSRFRSAIRKGADLLARKGRPSHSGRRKRKQEACGV